MGCHDNITHDRFPEQAENVGRRVKVCFHYDTAHVVPGSIVREDDEEPGVMIIGLDDGRFVLATECQYSFSDL